MERPLRRERLYNEEGKGGHRLKKGLLMKKRVKHNLEKTFNKGGTKEHVGFN